MRNGIAIAGNLIVDYCKTVDSYPQAGMLSNIRSVEKSVGGCLANTIIDIAKIDPSMDLCAIGMVGKDENGSFIIEALKKNGINTDGVKVNALTETSFTDVMSDTQNISRTFFQYRGANAVFDISDIDFARLNARFFHIGYALLLDRFDRQDDEFGTVMAKALYNAKQYGMKTSMDVVSENSNRFSSVITPSLKYCDYLIINEVEAAMICDMSVRENGRLMESGLKAVCDALVDKGVSGLVVVHAPEAACAMDPDGRFALVPSLRLPEGYIKGTVGAGDAFCAGVLYALYKGCPVEETLKIGVGAAACNLSAVNSVDGMRSLKEIRKTIEMYA